MSMTTREQVDGIYDRAWAHLRACEDAYGYPPRAFPVTPKEFRLLCIDADPFSPFHMFERHGARLFGMRVIERHRRPWPMAHPRATHVCESTSPAYPWGDPPGELCETSATGRQIRSHDAVPCPCGEVLWITSPWSPPAPPAIVVDADRVSFETWKAAVEALVAETEAHRRGD